MEFVEYPKQLYRSSWDDLSDSVVVNDAAEEEAARSDGFKMLSEDSESDASAKPARAPRKAKAAE